MGAIQNLIVCVKMAWSQHLAGSDCGDEYSLNTLQKSVIYLRDVCKNKGYRIIGGKQCHSVNKCNLFEITRMQSVNRRIAALFYVSVMKVLKVRPGVRRKKLFHRQISATRTTRYYDDFFIISKTNLSLSWLENLVRLCMLPSDKITLKQLLGTIRELQRVSFAGTDLGLSWHPVCICYLFYHLYFSHMK